MAAPLALVRYSRLETGATLTPPWRLCAFALSLNGAASKRSFRFHRPGTEQRVEDGTENVFEYAPGLPGPGKRRFGRKGCQPLRPATAANQFQPLRFLAVREAAQVSTEKMHDFGPQLLLLVPGVVIWMVARIPQERKAPSDIEVQSGGAGDK